MVDWELVISLSIPLLIPTSLYVYGRIRTRQRVAQALIREIEKNSSNCHGLRPHLIECCIVPGSPQNAREQTREDEPINYTEGMVPPATRFTRVALDSAATELSHFREKTSEEVYEYYRTLGYVSGIVDSLHHGIDLPPAAFPNFTVRFDEIENETNDLVFNLKVETKPFPRLYRLWLRIKAKLHDDEYSDKLY